MSESPPFEIPLTHFGFGRNDKRTRRGAEQLGVQDCELYFFYSNVSVRTHAKDYQVN